MRDTNTNLNAPEKEGTYMRDYRNAYNIGINDFALAILDKLSRKEEIDASVVVDMADKLKGELFNG